MVSLQLRRYILINHVFFLFRSTHGNKIKNGKKTTPRRKKEESVGQVVKEYSQDNYGEVVVTEVSDEIRK